LIARLVRRQHHTTPAPAVHEAPEFVRGHRFAFVPVEEYEDAQGADHPGIPVV
jgi:hypothetical protein